MGRKMIIVITTVILACMSIFSLVACTESSNVPIKVLIIETFDDDSDYLVPLLEGKNADGKFDYLLGEST
ncbi:MAG: hypothetical protein PUJ49_00215, partial [bacterium]|nr:hypothetical protein [bacterium]